jgi:hypothetical protein
MFGTGSGRLASASSVRARGRIWRIAVPPNLGMELTGLKRHTLCKNEEQRCAALALQLMPVVRRHQ